MREPLDPTADGLVTHDAWSNAAAQASAVELPSVQTFSSELPSESTSWRSDIPAARTLVRHTLSVGALAAGLIEHIGWQIARGGGDGSTVVPLGEWALGLARNLGGAVGVGFALASVVMLVPRFRKRPLRAASAAFTFGVAGFLGFLSFLLSLAP